MDADISQDIGKLLKSMRDSNLFCKSIALHAECMQW